MKQFNEFSFFKTLGVADGGAERVFSYAPDILEDDQAFDVEDISLDDDPDIADRDLLAAVMLQTSNTKAPAPASRSAAPASARSETPAERGSWVLPGFDGEARVATSFGDLPIKALRRRDLVKTISGAYKEVQWVDAIRLDVDFISRHPEALPVLLRAKSLGGVFPVKNMMVSPGQLVWVPELSGASAAHTAAKLEGRPGILRQRRPEFTYYRFHCGEPAKVSVEGVYFQTAPEK